MKCDVQGIYKNLRYRVLATENDYYIVDMGHSYLKFLLPFLFWMFTTPAYRLSDPAILDKFKNPNIKQQSASKTRGGRKGYAGWGASVGFLIAASLKPLGDYLLLPDTLLINTITLSILVFSVLAFIVYINNRLQNNMYQIVNLRELAKEEILIKPKSYKHISQAVGTYLFALLLALVFLFFDIKDPDIVTQLFTVIALLFYMFTHIMMLTFGQTKVKFKNGKNHPIHTGQK